MGGSNTGSNIFPHTCEYLKLLGMRFVEALSNTAPYSYKCLFQEEPVSSN